MIVLRNKHSVALVAEGATGSCQIIVHRRAMPKRLRSCETVDEAKRLRDSIEIHRLNNMNEMILMQNKQKIISKIL